MTVERNVVCLAMTVDRNGNYVVGDGASGGRAIWVHVVPGCIVSLL